MFFQYYFFFFFFNDTATTEIYPLSLHDALPIYQRIHRRRQQDRPVGCEQDGAGEIVGMAVRHLRHQVGRSEEHTSELQSPCNLVCRLLLEKKNIKIVRTTYDSSITLSRF